ncbi:transcription factor bHLH140 [Cucumis melo]|uniref:Transcription factor bHLH140 n=1 Tax=Cucumis melo TaxID=3656 RepID=A0A1S3B6C4_CUCME|nr:transcription factor bHLH140 [Cucumis melo]
MDMDTDENSNAKGKEGQGKLIMVILVGAPGSGKSTFCELVMGSSSRPWVRICQDTIGNGKSGTRAQCLKSATSALNDGKSVFVDRCNLEIEQRADFVKLGGPQVDVHAVVLDLPAQLCISRSVKRTGHEGNLSGGKAAAVVNKMLQKKELPKLNEGFTRITFCHDESDVLSAIDMYKSLDLHNMLPHGCFGQKNPDKKVQLGIMKFLKKAENPSKTCSSANADKNSPTSQPTQEKRESCDKKEESSCRMSRNVAMESEKGESPGVRSLEGKITQSDPPTLAFPSISTSDFKFSHEKAAEIIVEKVEEFMDKLGNARLVLVDLSHGSKILSMVKAKATEKNISSTKFFTFVGDITKLNSEGGLRCNVIANAANWRLKPGGGGVNAAIFSAAGPGLEVATKQQANSLHPGNAVAVQLPSTSPLLNREGVTHVIHVLGPNMNPQRPNYLNNDYDEGCKLLGNAYSSLFQAFISIVQDKYKSVKGINECLGSTPPEPQKHSENSHHKFKRENLQNLEISKKWKGSHNSTEGLNQNNNKTVPKKSKHWGSWAQALYDTAMHPERHTNSVLETSDDVVVLYDIYPKARKHLLVVARHEGLDQLADVCTEHLPLLRTMHAMGLKWIHKFFHEDAPLVFRLGYHSAPSMRQLHLHVISQDFDSTHLKNKKHWNSFNTDFFRDSVTVIDEVSSHGKARIMDDERLISMELRCNRCRSAHPNLPKLKAHISKCQAPFPSTLLEDGRLVVEPSNAPLS